MIFLWNVIETVHLRVLDRLKLGELQVDGMSATFTAESAKKYISFR